MTQGRKAATQLREGARDAARESEEGSDHQGATARAAAEGRRERTKKGIDVKRGALTFSKTAGVATITYSNNQLYFMSSYCRAF